MLPNKHKLRGNRMVLAAGLMLVLVILGFLILLARRSDRSKEPVEIPVVTTPTPVTYFQKELSFMSFSLPVEWQEQQNTVANEIIYKPINEDYVTLTINQKPDFSGKTAEELAKMSGDISGTVTSRQAIKVDNHFAIIQQKSIGRGIILELFVSNIKSFSENSEEIVSGVHVTTLKIDEPSLIIKFKPAFDDIISRYNYKVD